MRRVLAVTVLLAACGPSSRTCQASQGTQPRATDLCGPATKDTRICPGGPGSGFGYLCNGSCWEHFYDGPCAPPYPSFTSGPACAPSTCFLATDAGTCVTAAPVCCLSRPDAGPRCPTVAEGTLVLTTNADAGACREAQLYDCP